MWIIRGIIMFIAFVALVWLATLNAGTKITFRLFNQIYYNVELNVIVIVTFIVGMLIWAIGAWIREAQLLLRIKRSQKEIEELNEEIADLRNLPIEDEGEEIINQEE